MLDALLTFTVPEEYSIDAGQTWTFDTVRNSISPNSSVFFEFSVPADMSVWQDYLCIAVVHMPWDTNTTNDTLHYNIYVPHLPDSVVTSNLDTILLNPGDHFGTYHWNTGSTNHTIQPPVFGQYRVTVTQLNCYMFDTTQVIQSSNLILEGFLNSMEICPNPGHYFEVKAKGISSIEILDLRGCLMYLCQDPYILSNKNIRISPNLEPGIYLIRVYSKSGNKVFRWISQ